MIESSAPQLAPRIRLGDSVTATGGPPTTDTLKRVTASICVGDKTPPLPVGREKGAVAAVGTSQRRPDKLIDGAKVELLPTFSGALVDDQGAVG